MPDEQSPFIDPRSVVSETAELADGVVVEPFAVIGDGVQIGQGCTIGAHAVISGCTRLGANNRVASHAVLGAPPQLRDVDASSAGQLVIGDRNQLREFCTIHAGGPGSSTSIGDDTWLMPYSHVAHDCHVGDGVELANGVQLAGHVEVGDGAVLGGLSAIHQFVRVGRLAFVGAGAMVSQDVPPFCQVSGDRARLYGLNVVGLRRAGVDGVRRQKIARALRLLLAAPLITDGVLAVGESDELLCAEVGQLLDFVRSSQRGLCRPVVGRSS